MVSKAIIAQVLKERLKPNVSEAFDLSKICFKEQIAFVQDKSPWVTASCSRRSGKSHVCAIDLLETVLKNRGIICLYITLTRDMAERILWIPLLELNEKYNLGGIPNHTKLILKMPNKSRIMLLGCNHRKQVEKALGVPFKVVYFDESQSFPHYMEDLVDRVVAPSLMDYGGTMKFIGTPAPVKAGFFYNILQNSQYSHHHWTFWDNPYIPKETTLTKEVLLQRELDRRGITLAHPSIRREWYGEWVYDSDALVCKYDFTKNHYTQLPPVLTDYVFGIDLGFKDADAIAVIGWNKFDKKCYLVEELVTPKQTISDLMTQIETLYTKYNPLRMVMDEGGLGKKIGEELRKRYTLPIFAAEKSRKLEFIELMNDAFRTERLFIKNTTRFAKDSLILEWDFDKCTADKMVIKKFPHSDIFDAVLYGFRESLHWLSEPMPKKEDKIKNWAKIAELELLARSEFEEDRKLWEEKRQDTENIFNNYDPNLSSQENAAMYYVRKKMAQQ